MHTSGLNLNLMGYIQNIFITTTHSRMWCQLNYPSKSIWSWEKIWHQINRIQPHGHGRRGTTYLMSPHHQIIYTVTAFYVTIIHIHIVLTNTVEFSTVSGQLLILHKCPFLVRFGKINSGRHIPSIYLQTTYRTHLPHLSMFAFGDQST